MRPAIVGFVWLVAACGDDGQREAPRDAGVDTDETIDAMPDAGPSEVALVQDTVNRDLDLLFVIDDSPSMLDKQANLKNNFVSFISALAVGGLPNIHIGVITTDMGVKGADDAAPGMDVGIGVGSCSGLGKDGILRTSTSMTDPFISDVDGVQNYTGTLNDRFNELVSVGASGCGFEQPLHALRRALDAGNSSNTGFLRSTARLGIVVLSDEDDCSASHSTLFGAESSTLGPQQSFRCTRFGVTCDVGGQTTTDMNVVGTKSACHSNEQSAYLADIGRYVTFLNGLKDDPREVMFGAIVGAPAPVAVELRSPPAGGTQLPALVHTCTYTGAVGTEVADPAVRLAQVAATLPGGVVTSVCGQDLSVQLTRIATRLRQLVGDKCLHQTIHEPAMCEASDVPAVGAATPVPACDANNTPPCFKLEVDATACPYLQHLKVNIVRATPAASDVWTSVRCAL